MRRKDKYLVGGAAIGLIGGALFDFLFQWFNHEDEEGNFWDTYDWRKTLKSGVVGGAIGLGTAYVIHDNIVQKESHLPFSANKHLGEISSTHSLLPSNALTIKGTDKVKALSGYLSSVFSGRLVGKPNNTGSYERGTAVALSSDRDIVLTFDQSRNGSLEEIYDNLYSAVNSFQDEDIIQIRKQKKSVGLIYDIDGQEFRIDVIPARATTNFKKTGDLHIPVHEKHFLKTSLTYTKTNLKIHDDLIKGKPYLQDTIKLIKIWRDHAKLNLKSTLINILVIDAFDKVGYVPPTKYSRFKLVLTYIAENIQSSRIIDPANSNNILSDGIADVDKISIANLARKDLQKLKADHSYLIEMFPAANLN